jgi:hypothetical protein
MKWMRAERTAECGVTRIATVRVLAASLFELPTAKHRLYAQEK